MPPFDERIHLAPCADSWGHLCLLKEILPFNKDSIVKKISIVVSFPQFDLGVDFEGEVTRPSATVND